MQPKTARPATAGCSRPGLEDFRGQRKSGPFITRSDQIGQAQQRLRRQRLVAALHRLGDRPTYELIAEIVDRFGIEAFVDERLLAYTRRLNPELLQAFGGDRFAPPPFRTVPGRDR